MAKQTLKSCERALQKNGVLRKVLRRSKRFTDIAAACFFDEIAAVAKFPFTIQVRGGWREDGNSLKTPEAIIYRLRLDRSA